MSAENKSPMRFEDWQKMAHRLTNKLCVRFARRGMRVERDDIFQHVSITWMRCCELYDPSHGVSFATYFWRATELNFGLMARKQIDRVNSFATSLDVLMTHEDGAERSFHEITPDDRQDIEGEVDRNIRLSRIKEEYPIIGLFMDLMRDPPEELLAELKAFEAHQARGLEIGSRTEQIPTQLTPESLSQIFGFNWRSRLIMRKEMEDAARILAE